MSTLDIAEVAQRSGVPASTLRFYEEKGLIASVGRRGLRRVFDAGVLERLALIALGCAAGFSLDEIARMFASGGKPRIDRQLLAAKAKELDATIRKLSAMRDGLRHAAACPAPSHMECPTFRRLLGAAASGAIGRRKKSVKAVAGVVILSFAALAGSLANPSPAAANVLPVIDAHSQFDENTPAARVVEQAARAGVAQVLLSARGGATTAQLLELAAKHPGCIVPSVRTKGGVFAGNRPEYYERLDEQLKEPAFRAMSEIILAHGSKGRRAPEVNLPADAPQVRAALEAGLAKGWPIVLHYEFRWIAGAFGDEGRNRRMGELKSLAGGRPRHPFALIHMAQLDPGDAAELLAAHPNLVFLTSHANTLSVSESRQPWTNMFAGEELAPQWRTLVLSYPERFVLALDNVWREHWTGRYAEQVKLWRNALGKLPPEVAHAVAHGNAERLWKLAPAVAGEGCAAMRDGG